MYTKGTDNPNPFLSSLLLSLPPSLSSSPPFTAKVYALGEEVFTQELYPNLYSIWSEAEVVELFGSDSDTCFVCEASDKTFLGFVLGTEIEASTLSMPPSFPPWFLSLFPPSLSRFPFFYSLPPFSLSAALCCITPLVLLEAKTSGPPSLIFFFLPPLSPPLSLLPEKRQQLAVRLLTLAGRLAPSTGPGRRSAAAEGIPRHDGAEWLSVAAVW